MALATVTRRKPVTSGRNPQAPRGDRIKVLYSLTGSGTALTNLGHGDGTPSDYDGVLTSGTTWSSDSNEQSAEASPPDNVVTLDEGSSEYISIASPTAGEEFERMTFAIRFKVLGTSAANDWIFYSSLLTSTYGGLSIVSPTGEDGDLIRLVYRDIDSKLNYLEWDASADPDAIHTIVVTVGEFGLYAWLDGATPEAWIVDTVDQGTPPAYMDSAWPAGSMKLAPASSEMFLGRNPLGAYSNMEYRGYCLWDIQLEQADVDRIFADPYILQRTTNDIDIFDTNVGSLVYDLKDTSTKLSLAVDSGATGTFGFRLVYSTDPMVDSSVTTATVSSPATASAGEKAVLPITGLTADTTYYGYIEQRTDSYYEILPVGRIQFKTEGANARLAIIADDHMNMPIALTTDESTIQGKDIVDNTEAATHMAFWRMWMDIVHRAAGIVGGDLDAIISGGDDVFPDSAENATTFKACFPRWRNRAARLLAMAAFYRVVCNHGQEANYLRHNDDGTDFNGQQMLGTIYRKLYFPGLTNGEGTETGSYDTTAEWLASETDNGQAYWSDIEEDTTTNSTPLENFWEKQIGCAHLFGLDVYRYTGNETYADSEHGEHFRENPEFTFGVIQKQWLEDRLKASSAKWKCLIMHNLPGGEAIRETGTPEYYGWGAGRYLSTADEFWLRNLCKRHGVTAIFKGHDHRFTHVINQSLNIITIPTVSAPSLQINGWNYDEMVASHGDPFLEGADAPGVQKSINCFGYLLVEATADTFTVWVRNTWMSCGASAYSNNIDNGLTEHWLASNDSAVSGAGPYTTTLSERPEQVFCAIDASKYVDEFWDDGLTDASDNEHTPVGPDAWEGTYRDATITIDSNVDTRVAHIPRTAHTMELRNAKAGGGSLDLATFSKGATNLSKFG